MAGHTLNLKFDPLWNDIHATINCDEPEGAYCRDGESCYAKDSFEPDGNPIEGCRAVGEFELRSGMPIVITGFDDDAGIYIWVPDDGSGVGS